MEGTKEILTLNIDAMLRSMEKPNRNGIVYSAECIESIKQQIESGDFILHITEVKKHKPVIDLEEVYDEIDMRDATPEELDGVNKYIKSISEETGVDFYDALHMEVVHDG